MLRLEWAAIYVGVNILLLLVLAYLVSAARRKHKITLGDGGNEAMTRAIRAHANAAEYIPAGAAGIILLALLDPAAPLWLFHASAIFLTAGRVLHGAGLSTGTLNLGRMLGTALTWLALALMGGGLVWAGLSQRL
ncbi:MAG: MAPEG family protein [Hyphomonadaceae bacterium]|nr:MAPEG family protein [Hyphomonadaceae bacterium]